MRGFAFLQNFDGYLFVWIPDRELQSLSFSDSFSFTTIFFFHVSHWTGVQGRLNSKFGRRVMIYLSDIMGAILGCMVFGAFVREYKIVHDSARQTLSHIL